MRRPKRLIIVSHLVNDRGRGVLEGIREYCQKHGQWEFQLETNADSPMVAARVKRSLGQWNPDGIIAHIGGEDWDRLIAESGIPAVNISNRPSAFGTPIVEVDQLAIGRMVAQHFLTKGLKNFAYCGTLDGLSLLGRRDGFCRTVRDAGFTCSVLENFVSGRRPEEIKVRQIIERWLAGLAKPVGVMCCHNYRGQEVLQACRETGLTVPDEVAVVAVEDDKLVCTMANPPMSSVEVPARRIGYEAAALMHKMINGRPAPRKPILLSPVEVVVRASSEKVALNDPDIVQALHFIADMAGEPISVKDILKEVAMSRRSFERRFREMTGRTPKKQIMDAHIAHAKGLLVNTDIPIPRVAAQSGFVRPEVFTRVFSRLMGTAPSAYRKRFRVN
jgi:LacI family transcriptional regulator